MVRDRNYFNSNKDITIIASQIYALNQIYNLKVKVVKQSEFYSYYLPLFEKLVNITTHNQIINVHTNRREIRSGNNAISMKDFLFPYETTISFILLGISKVLLTGNDFPIIDFARNTIKKFNSNFKKNVPLPVLHYKKEEILKGYNYKKNEHKQ